MSHKKNIEAKIEETNKNIEELKGCLKKEIETNPNGMMKSIFRNSIQKQEEIRDLLQELLGSEPLYNFITYYPSSGDGLDNEVLTKDKVMSRLQSLVDDLSADGDKDATRMLQFMVNWQHDKSDNAFEFSGESAGDEIFIQEVE